MLHLHTEILHATTKESEVALCVLMRGKEQETKKLCHLLPVRRSSTLTHPEYMADCLWKVHRKLAGVLVSEQEGLGSWCGKKT